METRRVRYIIFKRSRIFGGLWSHVSEAWRAINRRCFREDKKVSRQWVRDAIIIHMWLEVSRRKFLELERLMGLNYFFVNSERIDD